MNEAEVGSTSLPIGVQQKIWDLILELDEQFHFNNGPTAAYWHLVFILSQHLGGEKQ